MTAQPQHLGDLPTARGQADYGHVSSPGRTVTLSQPQPKPAVQCLVHHTTHSRPRGSRTVGKEGSGRCCELPWPRPELMGVRRDLEESDTSGTLLPSPADPHGATAQVLSLGRKGPTLAWTCPPMRGQRPARLSNTSGDPAGVHSLPGVAQPRPTRKAVSSQEEVTLGT